MMAEPADDTGDKLSETEFVLGNVAFALMHELAHVLISERKIPIIGSEEIAADHLATIFLVRGESSDPDQNARLKQYAVMTALAFAGLWDFANEIDIRSPYWDDHGLSIQRYYRMLCLIHGSDPDAHPQLTTGKALPVERARFCGDEFTKANRAVDWLLSTYGRKTPDLGPVLETSYEEPRTRVEMRLLKAIRDRRLIELTLTAFQERFAVQSGFSVAVRRCGRAEAGWDVARRELFICHELLGAYHVLYLRASTGR